jgi:hypothetical protein
MLLQGFHVPGLKIADARMSMMKAVVRQQGSFWGPVGWVGAAGVDGCEGWTTVGCVLFCGGEEAVVLVEFEEAFTGAGAVLLAGGGFVALAGGGGGGGANAGI